MPGIAAASFHDSQFDDGQEDLEMMFLELFVPRGACSAEQLHGLAGRLTMRQLPTHADALRDVVDASAASSANPGVLDFIDTVNHVVVHEIGTWIAGGRSRWSWPAWRCSSPTSATW